MIVPFLALPIALQMVVADGVPNWDVTASCRGGAAGYADQVNDRVKSCLESEQCQPNPQQGLKWAPAALEG